MQNQLANMGDLKEKISEQIKVSIFNLLPEDKITQMVEGEINAFFEEASANYWTIEESGGAYGGSRREAIKARVSPFRLLVWNQLSKHLEQQLKELFESEEFISRCVIGDADVKKDIQDAAMLRQERIALNLASSMFDRMIGESLLSGQAETSSALHIAVRNVLIESGKL
jgi:hypothetical protein